VKQSPLLKSPDSSAIAYLRGVILIAPLPQSLSPIVAGRTCTSPDFSSATCAGPGRSRSLPVAARWFSSITRIFGSFASALAISTSFALRWCRVPVARFSLFHLQEPTAKGNLIFCLIFSVAFDLLQIGSIFRCNIRGSILPPTCKGAAPFRASLFASQLIASMLSFSTIDRSTTSGGVTCIE
jgi:hypothetical protein